MSKNNIRMSNNILDLLSSALDKLNENINSEQENENDNVGSFSFEINLDDFDKQAEKFLKSLFNEKKDNQNECGTVEDFKEPCCKKCPEKDKCQVNDSDNSCKNSSKTKENEQNKPVSSICEKLLNEVETEIRNEEAKNKKILQATNICEYVIKSLNETGSVKKYKIIKATDKVPHTVEIKIPLNFGSYYELNEPDIVNFIKNEIIKKTGVKDVYIHKDNNDDGKYVGIIIYMPLS